MESFSKVFWKVFFDQSFTFLTKKTKVFGKFFESFLESFFRLIVYISNQKDQSFWKVFFRSIVYISNQKDQSFWKVFGKFLESFLESFWKVLESFWKVFGKIAFFPTKFVIFPEVTEVTKFTEFGSAKGDCRSRECTNGNIASFLKHAKLVRVYSTVVVV